MPVIFPPPQNANEQGIVAIGGQLDIETLTTAYHSGIFPWPISKEYPLTWFSPDPRGVLDFNDFHIPRSLKKFMKSCDYEVLFNRNFEKVLRMCSKVKRKFQTDTWISEEIIRGYIGLFEHKLAYSVETYHAGQLIGGLYGVCMGEVISGESMFFLQPNASKVALVRLIEELQKSGIAWMDTQMVTPVIESFGGKNISRNDFLLRLERLDKNRSRQNIFGN